MRKFFAVTGHDRSFRSRSLKRFIFEILRRPLRGQARSHRIIARFRSDAVPVGAGLPAKGTMRSVS
ncbi:hypothetical protein E2H86_23775 [Pseudomonas putida]|nr:hypothetical protein E2H86_23775 [Pseudomonas putida]